MIKAGDTMTPAQWKTRAVDLIREFTCAKKSNKRKRDEGDADAAEAIVDLVMGAAPSLRPWHPRCSSSSTTTQKKKPPPELHLIYSLLA